MEAAVLKGGFADPSRQAAVAFRAIMQAVARPGTGFEVTGAEAPAPVSPAAAVVMATLCDADTSVALMGRFDCDAVRAWIGFHCASPIVARDVADFILADWAHLGDFARMRHGTPEYPDRSATVILEVDAADPVVLSGPGIKEITEAALPRGLAAARRVFMAPMGVDVILTKGQTVMGLPRSTRVDG